MDCSNFDTVEILILDEPITYLDIGHQLDILRLTLPKLQKRAYHYWRPEINHDINLAAYAIRIGLLLLKMKP